MMFLKRSISYIFLFLFLLTSAVQMSGQAAIIALIFGDKVASEQFNISLELGGNFSYFSEMEDISQFKYGLNFGIAGNVQLNESWYLIPSAFFLSKRTFDFNSYSLNTGNAGLDQLYTNKEATLNMSYIDVPILLLYQTKNKKFRFGLGPQISFLSNAGITVKDELGDFVEDVKEDTNNLDYGILSSVGYSLGEARKGKGLFVQLRYYQGFNDVFKDAISSNKNTSGYFSVHLSLPFITDELAKANLQKLDN